MIRLLRGLVAAALPLIVFMSGAQAQTFTQLQWGINRAASPANVCLLNGAACVADNLATLGTTGSRWANLFTSKLTTKLGSNPDSTGQPTGTFAASIYNATNTIGQNGLLVKNNWAASTSTIFEAGVDLVGSSYSPAFRVFGDKTAQFLNTLSIFQFASTATDIANTDSILGVTHSNGTWGTVNMNIKSDTTVYGAPDTFVWGLGSVFHYVGTGGNGLHNSMYAQAIRDVGRANPTTTVAVGSGGSSSTTVQVANATPFLNINGGTIGVNGLTAQVQFGPNGTTFGAGNRYTLVGVNTGTNVLTFSSAVAGSDIVLGNPVTARVNPELQALTLELRDTVDLPTSQKSSNTTMELDLAGNNVDDAGTNQMQVFSCFKQNPSGVDFQCTNMSAYYTFTGASTKNILMFASAYSNAGIDFTRSVFLNASARAIWFPDNAKFAWNGAGNFYEYFNSSSSRLEYYVNSTRIWSMDALTGKTYGAQAFIQDVSSTVADASRGFRQNIDGVEKLAMEVTNGGVLDIFVNGAGTPAQTLDGSGNAVFNGNVTGRMNLASAFNVAPSAVMGNAFYRCGSLAGANMNSTADQPITITLPFATYAVQSIQVTNPSTSLTTAVGGFYTGASKTGLTVVANSQVYSGLTTNAHNTAGSRLSLTVAATTAIYDASTIYFSLTTPQGGAATADVDLWCIPVR